MTAARGLIADIGATNARFALADNKGVYSEQILKCADYPGLVEATRAYLSLAKPANMPQSAAMAIAGPVLGDRFEMTNHVWSFSQKETQKALGLQRFHLVNDFVALAMAVPHLKDKDVRQIAGAKPLAGAPIGIIGPGTGLGVASLVWDGKHYIPVSGEGGHVTMPACNDREFALFQQLIRMKYHHISAERVCSGKGLVNIYNALRALDGVDLPERTPEEISAAALSGQCALCHESLDLMLAFLGRVAGNLALTLGTYGGIYIAGGIVSKLGYDYFNGSAFYAEFIGKGRFSNYMKPVPVFVIEHPFPAFVGLQADLADS